MRSIGQALATIGIWATIAALGFSQVHPVALILIALFAILATSIVWAKEKSNDDFGYIGEEDGD